MKKSAFPVLLLFFLLSIGVVIVSQKQQELRTRASANTVLALLPSSLPTAPISKRVGDTVSFDVMLTPGSNHISTVKIHITYDSSIFEVPQKTGFEVNKKAFPFAVEGPLINNDDGSVIATFFVGADPSQAITVPTKIGTLHLIALKETYNLSSTKIFFEETSQAYSLSSQDYAYENVIATTLPVYVVVRSKGAAAVPAKTGTPQQNSASGQAASKVSPTESIQLTPNPTSIPTQPPKEMKITFKTFFNGVGKNPLENSHPKRTTRYVKVFFENSKNLLTTIYDMALRYEESDGSYIGTLITPDLETGTYKIQMKSDGYLQGEISSKQSLIMSSDNTMPSVRLFGGDSNNDGQLSIIDYNLIFSCSIKVIDPSKCSKQEKLRADLDDNGRVDENDQFIFIKQNE